MEREIKFRGKLLKDSPSFVPYKKGVIIEGGFYREANDIFIVAHGNIFRVEPDSLSQYIGLRDKNGDEIFENDLFTYSEHKGYSFESFTGEIKYQDGCFGFKVITGQNYQDFTPLSEIDELQHDFLNHVVVLV